MTILNKVSNKTLMPGITAIPDVPDAPTIGAVTDLGTGTSASVAYTAAATGGTVTTFTATSTPGSITGTGSSPITVLGLTSGTAYTFKVKGTNATATGPESAASSAVTPILLPSYESIATVTVGSGGQSTISFTSIPSTYKHLQLRGIGQNSSTATNPNLRFNSDSGNNYAWHQTYGDGASAGASASVTAPYNTAIGLNYTDTMSNIFSVYVCDILDYANTNKYKTVRSLGGADGNGVRGYVSMSSGVWMNTASITTITITTGSVNFNQYSQFALYGIKG